MDEQREQYCLSELKERGWSPTLVKTVLGEPDELRRNPYYQKAAPMRLFSANRVHDAERHEAFCAYQSRRLRQREAAVRAADTKRRALIEYAESIVVTVAVIERKKLERLVGDTSNYERHTVNYLRHECSHYDELLRQFFGQIGVLDAQRIIRRKVYDAIAKAYPYLADECERQWDRRHKATR